MVRGRSREERWQAKGGGGVGYGSPALGVGVGQTTNVGCSGDPWRERNLYGKGVGAGWGQGGNGGE